MRTPTALRYTYYHCTKRRHPACTQRSLEIGDLERQIDAFLARIQITEEFRDFAKRRLPELAALEEVPERIAQESLKRAHEDCCARIRNLIRPKTAPGSRLADPDYDREYAELDGERQKLEHALRQNKHSGTLRGDFEDVLNTACAAREWFANGSPERKNEIIGEIGSNLALKDKRLLIEARKPYFVLAEALPKNPDVWIGFEPENCVVAQGQNGYSQPLRPLVRRVEDSNLCGTFIPTD